MAQAQFILTAVDRTQNAINSAMRGLKGLNDQASVLRRAFAGVGVALAGQVLTRSITQAIQYGNELGKAAIKSGVSAEAISGLAYAAKQSDVELSTLVTSLRKMQIALSDASTGGKSQNEALRALGLTIKDLKDLAPEEQFKLLGDRINMLESPLDRAKARAEIFGKSAEELAPMFEKGAAGINKMIEEAKALGVVLDEDQIKKLSEADTAVKKLNASWDGFMRNLTAKIAPALSSVLDRLSGAWKITETGMITRLDGLMLQQKTITDKLEKAQSMGLNIKGRNEVIASLSEQLKSVEKQIDDVYGKLLPEFTLNSKRTDIPKLPGFDQSQAKKILDISITSTEKTATAMQSFYTNLRDTAFSSFDDQLQKFAQIEAALLELRSAGEISAKQFDRGWKVAFNSLVESFNQSVDNIDPIVLSQKFQSFESLLEGLKNQGMITADELSAAWEKAFDGLFPMLEINSKKVDKVSTQMTEFARVAAQNMQNAFAQFLFDPFEGGLRGMLSNFVNILRQMVAQIIAQQILLAFFRMFTGGTGFMADFANAAVSSIEGRAIGGPVSKGSPYIVGERGPELFVPNSSGSIVPNNKMGGITLAPVYNIDARGATADLQKALPNILQENNRRIFDELDRRYGIGR